MADEDDEQSRSEKNQKHLTPLSYESFPSSNPEKKTFASLRLCVRKHDHDRTRHAGNCTSQGV